MPNRIPFEEQTQLREHARLRAKREREEAGRKRRKLVLILVAAAVVAVLAAVIVLTGSRRKAVDPFVFVTVTFSGGEGRGVAQMDVRGNELVDTSLISYHMDRTHGLKEGDIVTVTAESSEYVMKRSQETYTVSGLDRYLTELAPLSEEAIEVIHEQSVEVNLRNRELSDEIVHECVDFYPTKMYLLTDGEARNLLYDVYAAEYAMDNDEIQKIYLVTYYENIIVKERDEVTIEYGKCFYDGKDIEFGESVFHKSTVVGFESYEEIEENLGLHQETGMELQERDTFVDEEEEEQAEES